MSVNINEIRETLKSCYDEVEHDKESTNEIVVDDILLALGYNKKRDKNVRKLKTGNLDWDITNNDIRIGIKVYAVGDTISNTEVKDAIAEAENTNIDILIITNGEKIDIYAGMVDFAQIVSININTEINERQMSVLESISKTGLNIEFLGEFVNTVALTFDDAIDYVLRDIDGYRNYVTRVLYTKYSDADNLSDITNQVLEELIRRLRNSGVTLEANGVQSASSDDKSKEIDIYINELNKLHEKSNAQAEEIKRLTGENKRIQEELDIRSGKIHKQAEELLSIIEDSKMQERSYVAYVDDDIIQMTELHAFIGRVLQKLYSIKSFECENYIYNGNAFRIRQDNVKYNDMVLGNKAFDILVDKKDEDDALLKLKTIFSHFNDVAFACKKIGHAKVNQDIAIEDMSFDEDNKSTDVQNNAEGFNQNNSDVDEYIASDDTLVDGAETFENNDAQYTNQVDEEYNDNDFADEESAIDFGVDEEDNYDENVAYNEEDSYGENVAYNNDEQYPVNQDDTNDFITDGFDDAELDIGETPMAYNKEQFNAADFDESDTQEEIALEENQFDASVNEAEQFIATQQGNMNMQEQAYEDNGVAEEQYMQQEENGNEQYVDESAQYDENNQYQDAEEQYDDEDIEDYQDLMLLMSNGQNMDGLIMSDETDSISFYNIKYIGYNDGDTNIIYDINSAGDEMTYTAMLCKCLDAATAIAQDLGDQEVIIRMKQRKNLEQVNSKIKKYSEEYRGLPRLSGTKYTVDGIESIPDLVTVFMDLCREFKLYPDNIYIYFDADSTSENIIGTYGIQERAISVPRDTPYFNKEEYENIATLPTIVRGDMFNNIIVTKNSLQAHKDIIVKTLAIKTNYLAMVIGDSDTFVKAVEEILIAACQNNVRINTDAIGNVIGESYKIISSHKEEVSSNYRIINIEGTEIYCSVIEDWQMPAAFIKMHITLFANPKIAIRFTGNVTAINYYWKDFMSANPTDSAAVRSFASYASKGIKQG